MKKSGRLLGTVGAAALATLFASPAMAAATAAGTDITNTVNVSFEVGGVPQTVATASNTFKVDRKVAVTVAESGNSTTTVSPNQSQAVTTFTVTNNSNATLDFGLSVAQQSGGSGPHSNTDNADVSTPVIYLDTDSNGIFNSAVDTQVTYIDELAQDASRTIFVVADIPASLTNGAVAVVTLTATAREGGGTGAQGAVVTQTTGANTAAVDTVFADAQGATDLAYDGKHSARDDYTVSAATLTVTKTSKIVDDPINLTTNPKAIPGATIEYCIIVANASGSATATSVSVDDTLPTTMTYVNGTTTINGTATAGVCNSDGTAGGTYAAGKVSGTLSDVAGGQTRTLRFQAKIN